MYQTQIYLHVILLCLSLMAANATTTSFSRRSSRQFLAVDYSRGGALQKTTSGSSTAEAYQLLASAVQSRFQSEEEEELPDTDAIVKAFQSLAAAQKTFKGLDGAAHEAYQRTHKSQQHLDASDTSVSGRARRSAARLGATADGLAACELCDMATNGYTTQRHQVLLNTTIDSNGIPLRVLVLYEEKYNGGTGVDHGGLNEDTVPLNRRAQGRITVVVVTAKAMSLQKCIRLLDKTPIHVRTKKDLTNEAASVQPILYKCAAQVLKTVEPIIRSHSNTTAIHFVGYSLTGSIVALSSAILHGSLPMPRDKKVKRSAEEEAGSAEADTANVTGAAIDSNTTLLPLQGLGAGRSSAVILGAPPPFSANVDSTFIVSLLYGDDILGRISRESLDRLIQRTRRALKSKGLVLKQMNWMRDTVSLATSNIMSHAYGSEGEEERLAIPGRAFLIRPRRFGNACSMHEIGLQLKGGREALRAAILWQLYDVLLTKSLWKHHELNSYIHGLDRVQLRGASEDDDDESE